jgi:hypothetical protein
MLKRIKCVDMRLDAAFAGFLVLVGLVLGFMLTTGSQTIGITSDEPIERESIRDLRWPSDPTTLQFGVFGVSFQLLSHLAAFAVGIEELGLPGTTPESYDVAHLLSASMVLASSICVFYLSRYLGVKNLYALWGSVALLAVPVFLGHGMFNPKDIPIALGYSLFSLGLIRILMKPQLPKSSLSRHTWLNTFIMASGIWLAAGTRYVFLLVFVATVGIVFFCLYFLRSHIGIEIRGLKFAFFSSFGAFGFGLLLLSVTNPCLLFRKSPDCTFGLELLPAISRASFEHPGIGPTFLAGQILESSSPPWWYVPVSIWSGTPILIAMFCLLGIIVATTHFFAFWSREFLPTASLRLNFRVAFLVVALQMTLIPVVASVTGSVAYDSQRQFLFVFPALMVFASLGLAVLMWVAGCIAFRALLARSCVLLVAAAALIIPTLESARLWPYSYIYVNPLASINGFSKNWESDYWGASSREALSFVPDGSLVARDSPYFSLISPYFLDRRLQEISDMRGLERGTEFYFVRNHRVGFGWLGLPDNCHEVARVERQLRRERIPLSYVGYCVKR